MDSTEPTIDTPAPPKNKGGRPKGSRNRRPAGGNISGRISTTPPPAANDPLSAALFAPAGSEPTPPADTPPAKGGRPRAADVKDAELKRATAAAYRRLSSMLALASLPAGMLLGPDTAGRMGAVAAALDEGADECAAALVEWSRTNPRIRKMLENLGNGSGAVAVLAAHAPIMLALVQSPRPAGSEGDTGGAPAGLDLLALSDLLFAAPAPETTPPVAADAA